jgi:hypothetical protein
VGETPSTVRLKSLDAGPAQVRLLGPVPSTRAVVTIPPVGPGVTRHVRCTRALPNTAVEPLTLAVTGLAAAGTADRTAGSASALATTVATTRARSRRRLATVNRSRRRWARR